MSPEPSPPPPPCPLSPEPAAPGAAQQQVTPQASVGALVAPASPPVPVAPGATPMNMSDLDAGWQDLDWPYGDTALYGDDAFSPDAYPGGYPGGEDEDDGSMFQTLLVLSLVGYFLFVCRYRVEMALSCFLDLFRRGSGGGGGGLGGRSEDEGTELLTCMPRRAGNGLTAQERRREPPLNRREQRDDDDGML